MSDLMDIKLIIDKACEKLIVVIRNKERNDDVEGIIAALQAYAKVGLMAVAGGWTMDVLKAD